MDKWTSWSLGYITAIYCYSMDGLVVEQIYCGGKYRCTK